MNQIANTLKEVQNWFNAGVEEAERFKQDWARARARAINSGFLFLKARSLCPPGEWELFTENNSALIKPRTVRFYMQLATAALEWAREQNPKLTGEKAQAFAIREVMLMSPKPLIALLRDLRELRPFGEYDAIKHAQKKLRTGQIEFAFTDLLAPLEALSRFGDENCTFTFPEGRDELSVITEVEAKLEAALARVRQMKKHGRVIEA